LLELVPEVIASTAMVGVAVCATALFETPPATADRASATVSHERLAPTLLPKQLRNQVVNRAADIRLIIGNLHVEGVREAALTA
jgi:hypothetical protein